MAAAAARQWHLDRLRWPEELVKVDVADQSVLRRPHDGAPERPRCCDMVQSVLKTT